MKLSRYATHTGLNDLFGRGTRGSPSRVNPGLNDRTLSEFKGVNYVCCLVVLAFNLLSASGLRGAEVTKSEQSWPMFRGNPALTGSVKHKLPAKLTRLWATDLGSPIKSAAAVADGRVFVGTEEGLLHAIEFATGKKIRSYKTGGPVESSPLALGGTVYFGGETARSKRRTTL